MTLDRNLLLVFLAFNLLTFSTQVQSQNRNQSPRRTYIISVSALPSIGGTVVGGGTFRVNTVNMVVATPNSGYSFVNWTVQDGSVISTSQSFTFTLVGNAYLTANFTVNPVQPPCSCGPPS